MCQGIGKPEENNTSPTLFKEKMKVVVNGKQGGGGGSRLPSLKMSNVLGIPLLGIVMLHWSSY